MRFLFIALFFTVVFLPVYPIYGQGKLIEINGRITDNENNPVQESNIKLSELKSGRLIMVTTTGQNHLYKLQFLWQGNDSVLLTVSHAQYDSRSVALHISDSVVYTRNISLVPKSVTLENVSVDAGPYWQRGDTTFYDVNQYKETGQLKLRDIIKTMPWFDISREGTLTYKNRKIEKITIEGEDVFSDKTNLLLDNFPIHTLKTVQALENQNLNPVLKGLTGDDKVTVNLGLKNKKQNVFFGDVEAGAGTGDRYLLNPVLFNVGAKVQSGLISNTNSYGKLFGMMQEMDFRDENLLDHQYQMVRQQVQGIPGFEPNRYLQNQTFDNRLQLNIPVSDRLKTKTIFSYINDRQLQNTFNYSKIFSENDFIEKTDAISIKNKPSFFQVKEEFHYQPGDRALLSGFVKWEKNTGSFTNDGVYGIKGQSYAANSYIKNNWDILQLNTDYTKRFSEDKALLFSLNTGHLQLGQFMQGVSGDWRNIFQLPDSSYTKLLQPYNNSAFFANALFNYIVRKGRATKSYSLLAEHTTSQLHSDLSFQSADNLAPFHLPKFSGDGRYAVTRLTAPFSYAFRLFKQPLRFSVKGGIGIYSIQEAGNVDSWVRPLLNADLSWTRNLFKLFNFDLKTSYRNTTPGLYMLPGEMFPNGLARYKYFSNPELNTSSISVDAFLMRYTKNHSTLSLMGYYNRIFSQHLYLPKYFGFLSVIKDSIARGYSTGSSFLAFKYSFPFLPLKLKVTLDAKYNRYGMLTLLNDEIVKTVSNNQSYMLELKRKWKNRTFLTYTTNFEMRNQKMAGSGSYNGFGNTTNWGQSLSLKSNLGKRSDFIFSSNYLHYRVPRYSNQDYLFCDFEYLYTFSKKNISLRAKVENIFDEKRYQVFSNENPVYQSLYYVPLIGRNLFLSAYIPL